MGGWDEGKGGRHRGQPVRRKMRGRGKGRRRPGIKAWPGGSVGKDEFPASCLSYWKPRQNL